MSQSNNFPSSQGALDDHKPPLASRTDHGDHESANVVLRNQHKDITQNDLDNSQPTSMGQTATSRTSTPSPRSDKNKVDDVCGASTCVGIKQTVCSCEPCETRDLKCDGVRPMCNNCEINGRRCFYEY